MYNWWTLYKYKEFGINLSILYCDQIRSGDKIYQRVLREILDLITPEWTWSPHNLILKDCYLNHFLINDKILVYCVNLIKIKYLYSLSWVDDKEKKYLLIFDHLNIIDWKEDPNTWLIKEGYKTELWRYFLYHTTFRILGKEPDYVIYT